jgi:Ca2+-binding EF-hand superfamily protein
VRQGIELENRLLRRAFDMMDPKSSGIINEGTWVMMFRYLRPSYSKVKVALLFKILDEDGSCTISILFFFEHLLANVKPFPN